MASDNGHVSLSAIDLLGLTKQRKVARLDLADVGYVGVMYVRDLTAAEQLVMSRQAAVSQQLARLRHEKLVTTRRDGNQIIYSLSDPKVREMCAVIQRLFRKG